MRLRRRDHTRRLFSLPEAGALCPFLSESGRRAPRRQRRGGDRQAVLRGTGERLRSAGGHTRAASRPTGSHAPPCFLSRRREPCVPSSVRAGGGLPGRPSLTLVPPGSAPGIGEPGDTAAVRRLRPSRSQGPGRTPFPDSGPIPPVPAGIVGLLPPVSSCGRFPSENRKPKSGRRFGHYIGGPKPGPAADLGIRISQNPPCAALGRLYCAAHMKRNPAFSHEWCRKRHTFERSSGVPFIIIP